MIQIDVLPDDVLLGIFDFYEDTVGPSCEPKTRIEAWQTLVHVCRRWRNLIFGSPRRLNLRLFCTPKTPARDRLDIWPALPLVVSGFMTSFSGTDNIFAALGQSNRVLVRQCRPFNFGFAIGYSLGADASSIPRVDRPAALVT